MTLRNRILTGFALVVLLVAALGIFVVGAQRGRLIDQLDRQLEAVVPLNRAAPAPAPAAGGGGGGGDDRAPFGPDRPTDAPISELFIAAVHSDGTVEPVVQGQLLGDIPDLSGFAGVTRTQRTFATVGAIDGDGQFRVLAEPASGETFSIVVALPTTNVEETTRALAITFVVFSMFVAAVLGVIAWWVTRLGLRPISAMTETARAIAQGDRDRRAPRLEGRTEAAELATAFNVMLDQRDEAEARLRRFASDASHELRTPLTSIRGYLDLYADGGFRGPGQLDDVIRRMQSEADRMGLLVGDLLQLARLDEQLSLDISPTDVGRLSRDVVADALARHPERRILATAPEDGDAVVAVDTARVKQLVASLVDNALTHAPHADVEVRAIIAAEELTISVIDNGPGLTPEQSSQVFDRFYRGDASRARTTGGSGLGLAIAQSIAQAQGGTIDLVTNPGEGCEFRLRIPASPSN
ncbi:MAG: ATP-binding protein [Ilumatobacter sp.]